ncbi:MAG: transcription initiation factor IIB family protein [Promethearchaeota archaeon]
MILGPYLVENEKRAYTTEEISRRRQNEPSWRDFGPRTILPSKNIDSLGKVLNVKRSALMSRLSKIQKSLVNSLERNFWEAKPKLKMLTSKLNIPFYIQETAWKIYSQVAKKKLTMGRSIDGFITASLYAAIRVHEFPKMLEDVNEASMISQRIFFRSLGIIVREILPILGYHYHPISEEKLIFLIGNKLCLPMEIQIEAKKILKNSFKNNNLTIGKDPKGLAASALYLASKRKNFKKTQSEISNAAKITEVTLRSRLKDIKRLNNS